MLREPARGKLGIDQLAINAHLEAAPAGRDQGQRRERMAELGQERFRQTDGLGNVASGNAVFDAHFELVCHKILPFRVNANVLPLTGGPKARPKWAAGYAFGTLYCIFEPSLAPLKIRDTRPHEPVKWPLRDTSRGSVDRIDMRTFP